MAAYLIANVEVTNAEGYRAYAEQVPAVIAAYGGRYLAAQGQRSCSRARPIRPRGS